MKDIIGLAKELPEESFTETYEKLKEIKEKAGTQKDEAPVACPKCGSISIKRNVRPSGRQAYLCKDCGKSFVETFSSAIAHSHASETVWKQVIRDTVDGVLICGIRYSTAWNRQF